MDLSELVKKVKSKKELAGVPANIVSKEAELYLRKERLSLSSINEKDSKIIVSAIRSSLRRMTGQFALIGKGEEPEHKSSRERKKLYPLLKNILHELKVKSILDLGCGLNPIHLSSKDIFYYAYDINESDLAIVKNHLSKNKFIGETKNYDLRDSEEPLPQTDLCLILKVFDIIETKGHKIAERVLNKVNSNYILISFPTKTLSGRAMNHPQRGWIERLLFRLKFNYIAFKGENEVFYLASRQESRQLLLSLQSIQEMQL